MKYFFDFISIYWREILDILAIVVSIVLLCIKKKPFKVVDTLSTVIIRLLPSLIREAEASGLKGQDKLKMVLDELQKLLKSLDYGDDVIAQYLPFAANQVEVILSTPQKKGVKK